MEIIGIIPARGGSKGVPRKNAKLLAGKPLLAYSIEAAKKSELKDVYCSSEDEELLQLAKQYNCNFIQRPKDLASDISSVLPVLQHAASYLEAQGVSFDALVLLYPVYPFRNAKLINEAIDYFETFEGKEVVLGLHQPKTHPYLTRTREKNGLFQQVLDFDINQYYRRQSYPEMYEICHAILLLPKKKLNSVNKQMYDETARGFIIRDTLHTVNIDTFDDFLFAEFLLEKKKINL